MPQKPPSCCFANTAPPKINCLPHFYHCQLYKWIHTVCTLGFFNSTFCVIHTRCSVLIAHLFSLHYNIPVYKEIIISPFLLGQKLYTYLSLLLLIQISQKPNTKLEPIYFPTSNVYTYLFTLILSTSHVFNLC